LRPRAPHALLTSPLSRPKHTHQALAREGGHPQLTATHVALALLEDQGGVAKQV